MLSDYRNVIRCYLLPEFGAETPLEEITTEGIEAYRSRLLAGERLSRRSVQKVLVLLHGILKCAKRRRWIPTNPAEDVERVTVRRSGDFNVLSPVEVEAVARAAESDFDAAVIRKRRDGTDEEVRKDDMVRRLSLAEKLDQVAPMVTGLSTIKGTRPWQRFVALRGLRDGLVHVKRRGYSNDPDDPSALAWLLRGDAVRCVEDAADVIRALRPVWLREPVLAALGVSRTERN